MCVYFFYICIIQSWIANNTPSLPVIPLSPSNWKPLLKGSVPKEQPWNEVATWHVNAENFSNQLPEILHKDITLS